MKKKVNGKVVDIENIELFKEAFEGLAISQSVVSNITDTIDNETDLVKRCIEEYNKAYKSMPFPLYSIESNIKYATIATYLKKKVTEINKIWVDKAIFIHIEDNKYLKLASCNWAVVSLSRSGEDNVDITKYKGCVGYDEYSWILGRLLNNESTAPYYNKFMRDFVVACNKENLILKWELSRILDFGFVPSEVELKDNTIIDLDSGDNYFLDIFYNGMVKTKVTDVEIYIGLDGSRKVNEKAKYTKAYDFDGYVKRTYIENGVSNESKTKMSQQDIAGLGSMFEKILVKGLADDRVEDIVYTGLVSQGLMVYQLDNTIYRCNLKRYEKSVEVANNVNLFGLDGTKVYFYKDTKCGSGVIERTTYMFDVATNKLRLCRIEYRQA